MTDNIDRLAYKFRLEPQPLQAQKLLRLAGCCRFVWNSLLALYRDDYEEYLEEIESRKSWGEDPKAVQPPRAVSKFGFNYDLKRLKDLDDYKFLKTDAHSQVLQQKGQDLYIAYKNFFSHAAGFPQFKSKGKHDSFRYPQGFKLDEGNKRVYLPKIGWISYRKSRNVNGTPKNVTVSYEAGHWYIAIQCELKPGVKPQVRTLKDYKSPVGIDRGVARFVTLSDGSYEEDLNPRLLDIDDKINKTQRKLSRTQKGSNRRKKLLMKLAVLHKRKADIRKDFLHKLSTNLVKNHDLIVLEDLKVKNMTKSAKGTITFPGVNVRAKSGLNRSILNEGWTMFANMLEYKLKRTGGTLVKVNPKNTSLTCQVCGHTSKDNRLSQSVFKCVKCGFECNADANAAVNILRAGLARIAREVNHISGQQREPAWDSQ